MGIFAKILHASQVGAGCTLTDAQHPVLDGLVLFEIVHGTEVPVRSGRRRALVYGMLCIEMNFQLNILEMRSCSRGAKESGAGELFLGGEMDETIP